MAIALAIKIRRTRIRAPRQAKGTNAKVSKAAGNRIGDAFGIFDFSASCAARSLAAAMDFRTFLKVRAVGKSALGERFVLGTARKLSALLERKLGGLQLIAIMIDCVCFAAHVLLAAIGIDIGGKKQT